ncbi:MAG: hypothetical protein AAB289_05410 [Chloroflexota bacterium]
MRRNPLLRRAVENPFIQIAFHVFGGMGLGFIVAGVAPGPVLLVMGVALLSAAVLGHFYAVWSDPANLPPRRPDA